MKIVGVFAYRYEPDWMVDQLRENISWVDNVVSWDTRDRSEVWVPRAERVAVLQRRARKAGADFILHMDVDERLEDNSEGMFRWAADTGRDRFGIRFLELWNEHQYRIDGVWGRKWRRRFYRVDGTDPTIHHLDVNLYHLKMIDPENRRHRVAVHKAHNTWDNRRRGFDYLLDETDMVLEDIPADRSFSPPYRPYVFAVQP